MAYIRPANKKELVDWLLAQPVLAENGISQVEMLADALLDKFDLISQFRTPV